VIDALAVRYIDLDEAIAALQDELYANRIAARN